jgi:hypothetical protein
MTAAYFGTALMPRLSDGALHRIIRAVQFCPWGARDRAKRVLDGVEVA